MRLAPKSLLALTLLAGCATPPQGRTPYQPTADMQAVLTALQALEPRPIESLSPGEARAQPTLADAALKVAAQRGLPATPMVIADVHETIIDGGAGPAGPVRIPARIYNSVPGVKNAPIILYFHGGGFVIATNDTYDASARALANGTGAVVVSVEYRKGPEIRFPGAHDDAIASYVWVLAHAREIGGDRRRIALAGESAGGNLAIDTAIAARDRGLESPVHELLIYPLAGIATDTPSAVENARAKPLNAAMLTWFLGHYTRGPADLADPRLNVVEADLHGLPPTTIVLAQIDPLRSGGELLGQRLMTAGVPTETRLFAGTTHEFFGAGAVIADAKAAEEYASARLRDAFANAPRASDDQVKIARKRAQRR